MRQPFNVAYKPELIRRIRIVAAKNGERVADVVERFVEAGLPQEELQSLCDEGAVKHPTGQSTNASSS